jgi:secreted Zn-dependent insulinase-like peptidase
MSLLSSIAPVASAGDDRAYRVIELPNKLRAILVSDPLTDKVCRRVPNNCLPLREP